MSDLYLKLEHQAELHVFKKLKKSHHGLRYTIMSSLSQKLTISEESDQPKIKSATVEDNRPAFMKTRSNLVETMGLHREESNNQETVEPVIAIKSASVENTIVELPGGIKRIQNKFGRDQ